MKWKLLSLVVAVTCVGCTTGPVLVKKVDRTEATISEEGLAISSQGVRAWVEDIERDVAAATLVTRLGEGASIGGMALDDSNNRIVFSLIEEQETNNGTSNYASTLRGVPRHGGGVSQLTTGRWLDLSPAYGPEGKITFASNRMRPDGLDIFRVSSSRAGGVSVIRQTVEGYNYTPSVAEDGKMVFAFQPDYRRRGVPLANSKPQMWSIGGGNPYPTQLREGSFPALSPDGQTIAFTGTRGQLWTLNADGTNPIQLTTSPVPKVFGEKLPKVNATWSPDGQYIVYAAADGKDSEDVANYDIWIISKDGGMARQLTTNGSLDTLPIVSSDAKDIFFVSNRGFSEGIWRIPYPADSLK